MTKLLDRNLHVLARQQADAEMLHSDLLRLSPRITDEARQRVNAHLDAARDAAKVRVGDKLWDALGHLLLEEMHLYDDLVDACFDEVVENRALLVYMRRPMPATRH